MTSLNPPNPSQPSAPRPRGRPAGRTTADGVIADREVLLNAAETLIREQGPAVSLQAIADKAGVTKPTLYRGVGDRDALVKALAEKHGAQDTTIRKQAMAEIESMTARNSQWLPDGEEIPEKHPAYRFAKKYWFNDFGVYDELEKNPPAPPTPAETKEEQKVAV